MLIQPVTPNNSAVSSMVVSVGSHLKVRLASMVSKMHTAIGVLLVIGTVWLLDFDATSRLESEYVTVSLVWQLGE